MNNPILSIVIPTKDRHETLSIIIGHFLGWDRHDFEVVISDNSDSKLDLLNFGWLGDARLRYFNFSEQMTMVENSETAISLAKGEYICFIGDDDGLIESTVDICHWLDANDYDSASFNRAKYDWPGLTEQLTEKRDIGGVLSCPKFYPLLIDINPTEELRRYLKSGTTNIIYKGSFPYNGLLKRRIFEAIKTTAGSYFPGPTPDVSCAVASSLLSNKHAYINMPFICGGQSYKSAAGLGRRGLHVGEISEIKSLPSSTARNWTLELPHFWSGFTINAESCIKALEAFGRDDLRASFNFNRTIAACILYLEKPYTTRCREHVNKLSKADPNLNINTLNVLLQYSFIQMTRGKSWAFRKLNPSTISHHLDLNLALKSIQKNISTQYPDFKPGSDFSGNFTKVIK